MHARIFLVALFLSLPLTPVAAQNPWVTGLKNPESVAIGGDGRIYISEIGEFGKAGDGRILVVERTGAVPFASGLDDPKGLVHWNKSLYVTDIDKVMRVDDKGKVHVFAAVKDFPIKPMFLNDIAVDEAGTFYVSDSGDLKGNGGAIFRIDPKGKVDLLADANKIPQLKTPNGLVLDGKSFLLMLDFGSRDLLRIRIKDAQTTKVASGFKGGDGLAWDWFGRLYVTSWAQGKMWVIPRPGEEPILMPKSFESAADLCLDRDGKNLVVPDMKSGTLTRIPAQVPGQSVDDSVLALKPAVAFPKLTWTGWKGETDKGTLNPHRPIILTHAGDGSNRVFVASQQGVLHVFPNDPAATQTKIFLDISKKVVYADKTNEEGLLGLAFHPKYKSNGEFFIFYTIKGPKLTNIISRFKVKKDDPDQADPASEEEIFRIERPFWNHDGGTICFGPDGMLYVALGDGGAANDPLKNGQNLKTLLGAILRIDVDSKSDGKKYGIPKDNPFVGRDDAAPEIWAYGLRNVWRMAFDSKSGKLWASDVGQNLYEEIDIITRGGNYGWSLREGLHPFSEEGVDVNPKMIEPIWEYHHDLGKSNTGGLVYRGKKVPDLDGSYVYGDYITGKIWALRYDESKKRVVANRPIPAPNPLILSFGGDEQGEIYFLTSSIDGKGIFRFDKK